MAKYKQPKSINFLNPAYAPTDMVSRVYVWLISVGKYLLIAVELVVLVVFFSRFILDEKNNDLTDEINSQISLLEDTTWKKNNRIYTNYQTLLSDVEVIRMGQRINSDIVSEVTRNIPSSIVLESFSFNNDAVSLGLTALSLDEVRIYETSLKANSRYSDVSFNITKDDSEVKVGARFNIVREI